MSTFDIGHIFKYVTYVMKRESKTAELSLLDAFLSDRIARHQEPTRRGTKKGDPIGLSAKKYVATTCALFEGDLRVQARALKVSYGLLRKWRTEDLFWSTVEEHARLFVRDALLPYLRECYQRFKKQIDSGENPHLPELNDVPLWGEPIQEAIGEVMMGLKEPMLTAMQMLFLATARSPQTETKLLHAVISKALSVLLDAKATMADRQRVARMLIALLEQQDREAKT